MEITLEQRETTRQNLLKRYGMDPTISEATADQIRTEIEPTWIIQREEFNGFTLTFSIMSRTGVSLRMIRDAETALIQRYGNPPYSYATDFSQYRLSFHAN